VNSAEEALNSDRAVVRSRRSGANMSIMTAVTTTTASSSRPFLGIDWRPMARPALAIAIIVVTYRVSLQTLLDSMRLDTPLAHLSLVPLIALGLAYAYRNTEVGPSIHDRQLDWILGLFMMSVALGANVLLPARLSTEFWIWRIDLLTLPVFVAGVITLLFGSRRTVEVPLRGPVPVPRLAVPVQHRPRQVAGRGVTSSTIWGVDLSLRHIDLAEKALGSSDTFVVMHGGTPVQMSVASECSGANGIVGFLLVASAFVLVVDGRRWQKWLWLAVGALLVWLLNVGRILTIFWSAKEWGEQVAIDGFHPYVGLVVFNLAVLVMVLTMRVFGLRIRSTKRRPQDPGVDLQHGPQGGATPPYRPRLASALLAVVLVAGGVGVFNGQLRDYDRIANGLGSPRLADFASSQTSPDGWTAQPYATYTQYERFFGTGSTWDRYQYLYSGPSIVDPPAGEPLPALAANIPLFVDVVETPDRAALNEYGIEQCYSFHGYGITGVQSVDLGEGLVGGMLTWSNPETSLTWTTLYWHWPISTPEGTRYERVVLIMNDQPTNVFRSPELDTNATRQLQLDLNDVLRGIGSEEDRERLLQTRQFLIGFAQNLVQLRAAAPDAE
jgi:exosortase/archaeosortase family protein